MQCILLLITRLAIAHEHQYVMMMRMSSGYIDLWREPRRERMPS